MFDPIAGVQDDESGFVVDVGGVLDEVVRPVDAGEDEPESDAGLGCFLHSCPPLSFVIGAAEPLGGVPAGGSGLGDEGLTGVCILF